MKVTTITISAKDAAAYMENTNSLFKALWELTDLIREESKLKQHHRAYLHVRDNIDEKVKEAREIMFKVSGDMLRTAFESKEHEETADCEECVCSDCPHDCLSCKDSPCCDSRDAGNDTPFADAEDEDDASILFPRQMYDDMIDDMLTMAELIDMVCDMRTTDMKAIRELSKYIPGFAAFEKNRLSVYRDATKEAEDIINRWDEELNGSDEPDEYFSD